MDRQDALDSYNRAANAWEEDRLSDARASARTAWRMTAVASVAGLCGLGTAIAIAPLKTVIPYLIRVDSSTGVVDIVPPATTAVTPSEIVTRHLLHLYVVAKERYIAELAPGDYEQVGTMQSAQLNQQQLRDWDRANPESPVNLYRDGSAVTVKIHAITFLQHAPDGGEVAQVRFSTILHPAGGGADRQSQWIATLVYRYEQIPQNPAEREANPLGLRISEYQKEPEVATTVQSAGAGV